MGEGSVRHACDTAYCFPHCHGSYCYPTGRRSRTMMAPQGDLVADFRKLGQRYKILRYGKFRRIY